jgi:NitT/TauT family transport system substrate-binding protein
MLAALLGGIVAGSAPEAASHAVAAGGKRDRVRLQLKWVTQAQFAGYYIAQSRGFYADENLDVDFLQGGPDLELETIVAAGDAEFGIDWLPSLLASREQGLDLVNIAQVFHRSGTTEVTWKDSGISTIAGLRGKRVAVWCCGSQYELYAALRKADIDPNNPADVTIVDQPFDMDLLLNRQVDAAAATTYNELAQILETVNPATGRLYTPDDLNVMSMEDAGVGMLQDGLFTTAAWLRTPGNTEIAERFLRASFRGWMFCRDNPEACVQEVLAQGPTLGAGHQRWMMTEVNALIWPSPDGIGLMERAAYDRTVSIARQYEVITRAPDAAAYRTDLAQAALASLPDDTRGLTWRKPPVQITPGGR